VNDDLLYQTLADENPENWTAQVIDENQEKSPKKRKNEPINEQDNPFFPK